MVAFGTAHVADGNVGANRPIDSTYAAILAGSCASVNLASLRGLVTPPWPAGLAFGRCWTWKYTAGGRPTADE